MSVFDVWNMWDQTVPGIVMDLNYASQNATLIQNYIAQQKAAETARRQALADAYNAAVNNYNTSASSIFNDATSFANTLAGYNIASIKDRSEYATLSDLANKYANLTFTDTMPTFTNTFGINNDVGIWNEAIDFMPTLASLDSSFSSKIGSALSTANTTLDKLYSDRATEETRITDWQNVFGNDLNRALTSANSINFADLVGMNAGRTAQSTLTDRIDAFTSLLNPDLSLFRTGLTDLDTRLDTLFSDRAKEEKRIGDFRSGISKSLSPLVSSIGGLTIRDYDQIVGGQDTLNNLSSQIGAFSSILNPSFATENKTITDSQGKLGTLMTQRTNELDRINKAQSDYFGRALGLSDRATNADIYSKSALDSINTDIGKLDKDISGFSSLLDFDFKDSKAAASEAGRRISELFSQRGTELGNITSSAGTYTSGLNDVPLYEEDEFNDRKRGISEQINQLNSFTGDDLDPYKTKVQSAYDSILARLKDLYNYRGGIETDSRSLLEELNKTSFYNSKDVQDAMAETGRYGTLRKNADLYRATQADDELNSIENRYNKELARTLLDEKTRAELAAKEAASFKGRFAKETPLYVKGIPLTEAEYQAYVLSRRRQQEELYGKSMGASGFSKLLNVG